MQLWLLQLPDLRQLHLEVELEKALELCEQAKDQLSDLMVESESYRKQINHYLALVNIIARK